MCAAIKASYEWPFGAKAWLSCMGQSWVGKSPLAPKCARREVVTGQPESLMCFVPLLGLVSHQHPCPQGSAPHTALLKLIETAPWMCPAGTLSSSLWSLLCHLLSSLPTFSSYSRSKIIISLTPWTNMAPKWSLEKCFRSEQNGRQ